MVSIKRMKKDFSDDSLVKYRNALVNSVEGANPLPSQLCDLFFRGVAVIEDAALCPQEQREVLLKTISQFHKGSARRFFGGLHNVLEKVVRSEAYVPQSAFDEDEACVTPDAKSTEALDFMKASALIVQAYLGALVERRTATDSKTFPIIDEVFACSETLHNSLFSLQACGEIGLVVQSTIADLCEFCWMHNFADRECLVIQLLPLLLTKSLNESAQTIDIKRLFQLREGFAVLDWKHESSRDMRMLLLRTVSSPHYLKNNEGKKLIANLFNLDETLVSDLHKAIRVQIPDAKKTVLQIYGDIYFAAWKESDKSSETRQAIEELALQDFMYAILHMANPAMVKNLQIVLEKFHDNKKSPEIASLIHRLYGPIIWRALTASNPRVRINSVMVLAETFPLQDGISESDQSIQKGIQALIHLLNDSDPRVRVAAAGATAQILSTYWDVLPSIDIRTLLTHIVTKHASDKSSSAVRAGSLSAITILLGREQSHAVLRPLLPQLGNLIHDKVERVRIAAIRLLHAIKTTPGIKYYHVVPVDHLLARLSDEIIPPKSSTSAVASSLTQLMMNSYFPQGEAVTGAEQVKRTLTFLASDPNAAIVFYSNLASYVKVGSVSKLAAMLLRCLVAAVQNDKVRSNQFKCNKRSRQNGIEENEADGMSDDNVLSASDTAVMASIAETICTLWASIDSALQQPENEVCLNFLVEAFSGAVLGNVNTYFEAKAATFDESNREEAKSIDDCRRTCASILRCAGRLTSKSVEGLASQITMKLASFDHDENIEFKNMAPHVALLCMWGLTEDVSKSLAMSIVRAFEDDDELTSPVFDNFSHDSNKRKSGSGSMIVHSSIPRVPPNVALSVVEEILRGADPNSIAARTAILASSTACSNFESALGRATVYADRVLLTMPRFTQHMQQASAEFILRTCEAYGRFTLHKEATQKHLLGLSQQAKTLLNWTTYRVVPAFLESVSQIGTPLEDLNISRISMTSLSPLCPSSPSLLPPPRQRVDRKETPDKFRTSSGSFIDVRNEISLLNDTSSLARVAAKSLIQSSSVIFSEWLAVGGCGAEDIAGAVVKWCEIFYVQESENYLQSELLPSFLRLAVQLCKSKRDFSVFRVLIENCDESMESNEADIMKKAVSSLLCGKDAKGMLLGFCTVKIILDAADHLLQKYGSLNQDLTEAPNNLSDVWIVNHGYMRTCLSAIMSNKQAVMNLADELVSRIRRRRHQTDLDIKAVFETQCLRYMCHGISGGVTIGIRKVIRKIDTDCFYCDGPLKNIVGIVLESAKA